MNTELYRVLEHLELSDRWMRELSGHLWHKIGKHPGAKERFEELARDIKKGEEIINKVRKTVNQ
jgi:hypothetical protein